MLKGVHKGLLATTVVEFASVIKIMKSAALLGNMSVFTCTLFLWQI